MRGLLLWNIFRRSVIPIGSVAGLLSTTCECFGFAGTDTIVTLSVIAEVFLLSYRYLVHPK